MSDQSLVPGGLIIMVAITWGLLSLNNSWAIFGRGFMDVNVDSIDIVINGNNMAGGLMHT